MRFCSCGLVILALLALPQLATAATSSDEPDDAGISAAVQLDLVAEDPVLFDGVEASTENGVVKLTGTVYSLAAKYRAARIAESVKGVLAVDNDIDVDFPTRLDADVKKDVISALAADPVTDSYEIDVSVKNGVVTLSGKVDSYTEMTFARNVAEDVRGVKKVDNQLTYELTGDRSDYEIKTDIEGRLRADASIDAGLIDVTVDDGRVTLSGSVGSAAEKTEARDEAWFVLGVKSIDNNLKVKWWLRDKMNDSYVDWSDRRAERAVENRLFTDLHVDATNVTVDVYNGIANLTGAVGDLRAKRSAEQDALDTLGVWKVNNFLTVDPTMDRSDLEIARDIKSALTRSPYVDSFDIQVEVVNGKAELNGEVDSAFMYEQAEEVAAAVPGVVEIDNDLIVDYEYVAKSDNQIEEDINSQLWWSPFVDSDDITVAVHDGVATLWGTVEDWSEERAAEKNARDGGATDVISKLRINQK